MSDSGVWLTLRAAGIGSLGDEKEVRKTAPYLVGLSCDRELSPALHSASAWQLAPVGFNPSLRFREKQLLERCQESPNCRLQVPHLLKFLVRYSGNTGQVAYVSHSVSLATEPTGWVRYSRS